MTTTAPATADTILTRYADDIAFVAEEQPATTLADLAEQVSTAGERLAEAHINGAEDLETAANALRAVEDTPQESRHVFLQHAAHHLRHTADMVDEYRLMV
ncbi:hypothetical protein [Streptomyces sp. NPDC056154]|uniref:hypothetical protein n=1 Tax=unclassified Streptomyces TaxID=2593676 RepID=UPI0035E29848